MAIRPVYVVSLEKDKHFKIEEIEFKYFSGFSIQQKRRSINSLHAAYLKKNKGKRILEISTKSENVTGVQLSAFNLMIETEDEMRFSVESAFQSSKVFENGKSYKELLYVSSREAKRDERLKNSGNVIEFSYFGNTFPIEPKTYFYNWLYINALESHPKLKEKIIQYDAFTDIAFNPQKSLNCQAEAAAVYVSLYRKNLLKKALQSKEDFLSIVYSEHVGTYSTFSENVQLKLFD